MSIAPPPPPLPLSSSPPLPAQIERLKVQLSQQESSKRAQNEEMEKLQQQLESLRKEEKEYKQKVCPMSLVLLQTSE